MRTVLRIVLLVVAVTAHGWAQEWPQWRGPSADGIADVSSAPVRWSATDGVRWKTALVGHGTSTPVIADNRIFLTGQIGSSPIDQRGAQFPNTRPAAIAHSPDGPVMLVVQALHLEDGRTLWEHRFPAVRPLPAVHRNHNLATPSVATDGALLFAWFGTGQLFAFDVDGRLVWERHLGQDYGPFETMWGHASSPVVYEDVVILLCDHAAGGYLVALDTRTGAERWKVDRGPGLRSYSTPLAVADNDHAELIVNSSARIDAFDPKTGARLWHAGVPVELAVGMPVYRDGMLFTTRGYASSPYLAVATGGLGDVSDTHIRWRHPTRAPYVSSLLLHDGLLYMATEHGVLTVTDATSGTIVWRERLGGVFTASPVAAGGHVYFLNESGETAVVKPGREPTVVSRNRLGERSLASPAVVEGRILIRTDQHLFCIDGQAAR
ncbi:MAG: PQQ-binding-like beta-propeller repeat protein [Vicinamibacterales bacterium]